MKILHFNFCIFFLFVGLFFSCTSTDEEKKEEFSPKIQEAKINVSGYDFENQESLKLNGEWEFYWMELITPSTIDNFSEKKELVEIPNEWKQIKLKGGATQTFGYATYRISIQKSHTQKELGLVIPTIGSAYQLWINGELMAKMGEVGTSPEGSKPQYIHQLIVLPSDTNHYELVLQVSNFNFFRGGVFIPFQIGNYEKIYLQREAIEVGEIFQIGCLFFMGFYHILLFFYRSQDKSTIYLSLTVFLMMIRTMITNGGSQVWLQWFPNTDFDFLMRLEYIGIYSLVPLSLMFTASLFKEETNVWVLRAIQILGIILLSIVFFTPPSVFGLFLMAEYLILPFGYFYIFYILFTAFQKKKTGAGLVLIGYFMVLLLGLTDMLQDLKIMQLNYFNFTSVGLVIFMLCQASAIAIRFSKAFKEVEELTDSLEIKVRKRTERILKQNKIIKQKNDDILDSIHYAERIQNALLPTEASIRKSLSNAYGKYFSDFFIFYQPKDIISGDFYWFEEKKYADNTKLFIAVVDCTGHGVPGAFMSTIANILLSNILNLKNIDEPALILEELNKDIKRLLKQDESDNKDGMDIALCMIDPLKQELTFAGAKRPLIYFKNNNFYQIKGSTHPIGNWAREGQVFLFEQYCVPIEKGDVFYMFSDGYADQFGKEKGRKFLVSHFKDLLKQVCPLDLPEQKNLLKKNFKDWKQNLSQTDDILILGIKI